MFYLSFLRCTKKFAGMKQLHTPLFQYSDDEMLPHYVTVDFVKQPKKKKQQLI